MSLKTKQSLSINNKLAMTQQIQLAIKLLQLNSIDLQKEIEDKILENPFLENENSSEHTEVSSEVPVVSMSNQINADDSNQDVYEQLPSSHQSLHEYLMWQINLSSMSKQDQFIAYNIIDYINDDGFLTESVEDLFILLKKNIETTFQEIFAVLHKIQHLDPIGVGATSLKDCLLIQLNHFHKDNKFFSIAKDMINKLEDDIKVSMLSYDSFVSDFEKNHEARNIVKSLNPKPGNIISDSLHQEHITPDIIVVKRDAKWVVELNPSINPRIRINKAYKELMETIKNKDDKDKKSVVLVEYPRKDVWAVGFATKENKGEMAQKTNKKLINVFVPTTPNPTSGFLLMFPIDEVIYLNMTFEEASKFIVSAGTSSGKN